MLNRRWNAWRIRSPPGNSLFGMDRSDSVSHRASSVGMNSSGEFRFGMRKNIQYISSPFGNTRR